jgi:hypothetical protein
MMCTTKVTRVVIVASLVLGMISFVCLILYFLALTDIWHESSRPDFWRGDGLNSFEWRFLVVLLAYVPLPFGIFPHRGHYDQGLAQSSKLI